MKLYIAAPLAIVLIIAAGAEAGRRDDHTNECGEHEVIVPSPPACEDTCDYECDKDKYSCTNVVYKPTCVCLKGFVRLHGKCVPKSHCPPRCESESYEHGERPYYRKQEPERCPCGKTPITYEDDSYESEEVLPCGCHKPTYRTYEKPEPKHKKPEPCYEKPEPYHHKPETYKHKPEPCYEKPEHYKPKPEPCYEKPEHYKPKPEPCYEKPEHYKPKPEPCYEKPEHYKPKPEPCHPKPEPCHPKPEPCHPKPEPCHPKPEPTTTTPAPPPKTTPEPKKCCACEHLVLARPCCEPTCDNDCSAVNCPLLLVPEPTCACLPGYVRYNGHCITQASCPRSVSRYQLVVPKTAACQHQYVYAV
ncbi:uncharacterized protein LOC125955707 [Anopheles darlingi]|uniref:uncharacterized protein LOC125955707 n=1 Tax=Anopheles darlingi TaxID=43151 RepID=UPI0021004A9C|nr:uncharacterized protein LOC125955707 [Anopheles darlingi]